MISGAKDTIRKDLIKNVAISPAHNFEFVPHHLIAVAHLSTQTEKHLATY